MKGGNEMGETVCKECGYMNWHIRAHATGKCERCGKPIKYCDSCMVAIPEDGDDFGKRLIKMQKLMM